MLDGILTDFYQKVSTTLKRNFGWINPRVVITISCFLFIGFSIFNSADKLRSLSLSGRSFLWLAIGIFISVISLIINAIAWKSLLQWMDYRTDKIPIISLFLKSNILKYLPGGIWHFLERVRTLKPYLGARHSLTSVVLEPFLMLSAGLLFVPLGGWLSGLSVFCFAPSILFFKRWREPLIRRLQGAKINQIKKFQTEVLSGDFEEKYFIGAQFYPLLPLLLEMIFVLFRFLGFWCCLNIFSIDSSLALNQWLAVFSFSWIVGLIIPAAPGGVGVLEAVMLFCLGALTPRASLIAALLCYRLVVTIADVLVFLLAKYLNTVDFEYSR